MKQSARPLGYICRSTTLACRHASNQFILVVLALLVQLTAGPVVSAANLTWDASGTNSAAPTDGAGNWSTANTNWSNGSIDSVWTNGDSAILGSGGAGGTVNVGAGIVVANITLNTNYILSGNTLTLTNSGIITAALGTSNVIGSFFGGNVGWTLEGGGVVNHNISGNDTYTGTAVIDNGTVFVGGNDTRAYFSGDVIVNSNGTLVFSSGGQLLAGAF